MLEEGKKTGVAGRLPFFGSTGLQAGRRVVSFAKIQDVQDHLDHDQHAVSDGGNPVEDLGLRMRHAFHRVRPRDDPHATQTEQVKQMHDQPLSGKIPRPISVGEHLFAMEAGNSQAVWRGGVG